MRTSLLLLACAIASLVFAGGTFGATVTDKASLMRHGKVAFDRSISAKVNVHTRFSSIRRVCFAFAFEDDLLDPGEEWSITSRANLGGFEMRNEGQLPIIGVAFCLRPEYYAMVDRFRDGREKLTVSMERPGSMRIHKLEVTIRGSRL
jgi:hypothetical protein